MTGDALWVLVLVLVLVGLSMLSYSLRVLDLLGAVASFLLGMAIVLVGGLGWLLLMVAFTGLSYLATQLGRSRKQRLGVAEARDGERGLSNVVGNGAAPALAALTLLFMDPLAAKLAFITAVAAITADTMGSEVGTLSRRARLIIPPFEERPPGTNGAVSWLGHSAALGGAVVIAVAGVWLVGIPPSWAVLPVVAGFLGSQLDSFLGATLERDHMHLERPLSKQDVNFLSSFVPALVVLVAVHLS